ncbi:hypothetical protein PYW07_008370 [Mythimna separata]|uniref:Luciferin 4-monooxygenase-like n=1 Tax=Mythimna separata TaxID=271217 RepID=A0AAD7YCY2_MYTSE|nr:hypothetical protein PYW07_008370 [Mythimna separata]
MTQVTYKNEVIDNYMSEFTSRIISETRTPSDQYHLGKIILQSFKDDPDFVLQIHGGTGESETNGSMLRRSIQCATTFRNLGLKTGDTIVLMAPNHLDQPVPFYAALYLGIAIAAIDRFLGVSELEYTFNIIKPKIIFCQSEKVQDVQKAVAILNLDSKIVSFDTSSDTISLSEMLQRHSDEIDVENFKPADFDPEDTIALLISTSGTTGLPKSASLTHMNMAANAPTICAFAKNIPPTRSLLIVAPLQWLSVLMNNLFSSIYKYTRIQSSHTLTTEHILEMIGKYKPTFMILSPTMMTTLLNAGKKANSDFSCFEVIHLGGSAVPKTLVEELRIMAANAKVADGYGMSEMGCIAFYSFDSPVGSCGKPFAHLKYKLVNIETGEEIKEPNRNGELWIKSPGGFKGYYNNPEATAEVLSKDGWFMTGDMMYRDDEWNFYFVERIKLLLKYRNHQISPVELEDVIRQHPGVQDVAVTSLPDAECGDLPVACVIPRLGAALTETEIKDLVKEKLTDTKQLRGGVIFLKELPLTTSTKVHRRKLKEIALARLR